MLIIHGADTGSIEEARQCFLYDVPDDVDTNDLEDWLVEHLEEGVSVIGLYKYPLYNKEL